MAARVDVSEIEKLRPELLDMSVAELERRKVEIDMAIARKAEQEAEERRAKEYEEAVVLTEQLVKAVTRLQEIGRLPPRLLNALSKEDGSFVPGLYLKKPRA